MAKINLDIGHALSREDQRQNRRQPYFISQSPASYSFSGNHAAKFSKQLVLTIFRLFGALDVSAFRQARKARCLAATSFAALRGARAPRRTQMGRFSAEAPKRAGEAPALPRQRISNSLTPEDSGAGCCDGQALGMPLQPRCSSVKDP